MTTLTEFLLARIAEDEARWTKAVPPWSAPHTPDCDYPGDMPGICTCDLLNRLKSECEAKRAIVGRFKWVDKHPEWANDMELAEIWEAATDTLEDLATIYAPHPDFDEAWRP